MTNCKPIFTGSYGNMRIFQYQGQNSVQQLQTMLELQDGMNTRVNENWRGMGFAWSRAIWIECAELMDHYGWKWWKHQTADMEQVKLELIDIWHFGLSYHLQQKTPIEVIHQDVQSSLENPSSVDFHQAVESFTEHTLVNKAFSVPLFMAMLNSVPMSFAELYTGYIGKNVLNFFRQDHGYKEGTYRKVWSGKEDNEHLVEIISQLDSNSADFSDRLYQSLVEAYERSSQ